MIFYPDQPDTDPTKDNNANNDTIYVLRSPYTYITMAGLTIVVPVGFKTDEASIPRVLWTVLGMPPDGYYRAAGVVHDYLYVTEGLAGLLTRKECDSILRELLNREGVSSIKSELCYLGVRLGGRPHWGKIVA